MDIAWCCLQDPRHLYTFCPEFHHSMTLPKNTLKETLKEERRRSRKQWMTSFGWRSNSHKGSVESNRHRLYPDESKITELMIVCIHFVISRDDGKGGILRIGICTSCNCVMVKNSPQNLMDVHIALKTSALLVIPQPMSVF